MNIKFEDLKLDRLDVSLMSQMTHTHNRAKQEANREELRFDALRFRENVQNYKAHSTELRYAELVYKDAAHYCAQVSILRLNFSKRILKKLQTKQSIDGLCPQKLVDIFEQMAN